LRLWSRTGPFVESLGSVSVVCLSRFLSTNTPATRCSTLSLHDALPIYEDRGRGDLRPRPGGADIRRRGGGDPPREPRPVRPGRRHLDEGRPKGAPRRPGDQGRHGMGQYLQLLRSRGALRGLQVFRVRTRSRPRGPRQLHRDENGVDRPVTGAYLYTALRTPVGKHGGSLAGLRADDLAAIPIKAVVERSGIDPRSI